MKSRQALIRQIADEQRLHDPPALPVGGHRARPLHHRRERRAGGRRARGLVRERGGRRLQHPAALAARRARRLRRPGGPRAAAPRPVPDRLRGPDAAREPRPAAPGEPLDRRPRPGACRRVTASIGGHRHDHAEHRPGEPGRTARLRGQRRGTSCGRARKGRGSSSRATACCSASCCSGRWRAGRAGSTRRSCRRSTPSRAALWNGLAGGALLDDIAISLQRAGIAFAAAVVDRHPARAVHGPDPGGRGGARSDPAALPPDLGAGALPGLHPAARARRSLEGLRDLLGDAVPAAAGDDRRRQAGRPQADRDGPRLRRLERHGLPPRRAARRRCPRSSSASG